MSHYHAQSYRDLIAYKKSRMLANRIFQITKVFPAEEKYSLTDQIRRSSRSIGANIAESWAKRRYEKHFISKLTDADGEQLETAHWISVAADCGYIDTKQRIALDQQCAEIGRILGGMIAKSASFCSAPNYKLKESSGEYTTDSESISSFFSAENESNQ